MFDFAWSEIALIGVVALVVIGPKDMPVAIRAVAKMVKKAKGMAAEFQTHVDEMVREADLHEVREGINSLRRMDLRGHLERTVDPDGSIRSTLRDDPFKKSPTAATPAAVAASEAVATGDVTTGDVTTGDVTPEIVAAQAVPAERPLPAPAETVKTVDLRPVHEVALPEPASPLPAGPPPASGAA